VERSILVTGPQGFAGSNLLAQLGERGLPADVDVTDAPAVVDAVRSSSPGAIVHLAAVSSVTASTEDPGEAWRVNVVGSVNLLEAARAHAPDARVLMVSTGEVYGRAAHVPTAEDAPVAPISQYAASKAAAEVACGLASRSGLEVVVARAFQHEGPGRNERFAVGSWTAQIARAEETGGRSVLVGDLSSQRDITDVRDICRAYELLLDPSVPAGTYNIASGRVVEMRHVLDLLVGMARCPIEVEADPERSRRSDLTVISGDPSRLHAATGWTPTIPLEQTLADALDFARHAAAERMAST
jgi:GDP-4-dehydro-6-deoxy-D-mannose reductase